MYSFNNFIFTADCSSGVGSYIIMLIEIRNNERTGTFLRILISFIEMVNRILKKVYPSFFIFTVICNSHTTLSVSFFFMFPNLTHHQTSPLPIL